MPAKEQLLLHSIDDYLGPGETRFFSRGYQRAGYDVHALVATPAGAEEPGVRGTLDLDYPADWSKKKDGDLRPHLSTVDALVLGVQLAELHLAHAYGLGPVERRSVRLRKVSMRAGTTPQEDLTGVPLTGRLVGTEADQEAAGGHRSSYECTVGKLVVRCTIEHPVTAEATAEARWDSLTDALGPGEPRFYGEGFKLRRHTIEDVRVDTEELSAAAAVRFTPVEGSPAPVEGIEGDGQPSVSLVDCFVVNLQLAQVLMYELDSITRAESNTLWMMQTVLTAPELREPLPAAEEPLAATAAITDKRLLPLRGGRWRSVGIQGRLAGVEMRCTFAHELPERVAATAT
ncbi:hypothetical protein CFP65_4203 [Kitasatospora sp. MMS16-BH015]|uniref:AvrD family protein n=1 Tax=Kitasatospora sp. MMS16-BH015 TaxID=2018025 RepID=UPI000CA13C95|nr:AvrD family protein [Kitasatospora sp. MMS16-BH015]AUG78957.1 hypothetical protein CFP65_4203 [Kitasatospora sp. MMS16-BH015]